MATHSVSLALFVFQWKTSPNHEKKNYYISCVEINGNFNIFCNIFSPTISDELAENFPSFISSSVSPWFSPLVFCFASLSPFIVTKGWVRKPGTQGMTTAAFGGQKTCWVYDKKNKSCFILQRRSWPIITLLVGRRLAHLFTNALASPDVCSRFVSCVKPTAPTCLDCFTSIFFLNSASLQSQYLVWIYLCCAHEDVTFDRLRARKRLSRNACFDLSSNILFFVSMFDFSHLSWYCPPKGLCFDWRPPLITDLCWLTHAGN